MANFPQAMEYPAEFLRGWPVDGGLELSYPIASGQTLSAGDLVKPVVASGVVYVTKVVDADELLATAAGAGIVVRGNGDDKSAAASNKAIVLWGHYIVRTQKVDDTVVAKQAVVAGSGTSQLVAATDGIFVPVVATTAPEDQARLGYVLEVGGTPGSASSPFYAVIVVR